MAKGTVHAGADGPRVVFGKLNVDYQPQAAASSAGTSGGEETAKSDFSQGETDPRLLYSEYNASVIVDTSPLIDEPDDWDEELEGDFDGSLAQIDMSESEWEFSNEVTRDIAGDWVEIQSDFLPEGDTGSYVLITGENMGWMSRGGARAMDVDDFCDNPVSSIGINGDFTQSWDLSDGSLSANQRHHDVPVGGESYNFHLLGYQETEEIMQEQGYEYFTPEDISYEALNGAFDEVMGASKRMKHR